MPKKTVDVVLEICALQKKYEVVLNQDASMNQMIPCIQKLLKEDLEGVFVMDEETMFLEKETLKPISRTVTLSYLHLYDGMEILVF